MERKKGKWTSVSLSGDTHELISPAREAIIEDNKDNPDFREKDIESKDAVIHRALKYCAEPGTKFM